MSNWLKRETGTYEINAEKSGRIGEGFKVLVKKVEEAFDSLE